MARVERERLINPLITINAPIDGTVIARKVGPGQYVRSDSGDPLYSISNLSTMWLKANVPENDIPLVRVGQEIEVRVAAVPDRVFKARVIAIGAASDSATRRVSVRSEIPNPDGALKSEMFATFKIATGDGESSPGVPTDAVIWEGERGGRVGGERADALPAPQSEDRTGAGRPSAGARGPQARRAGGRARRHLRGQRMAAMSEKGELCGHAA